MSHPFLSALARAARVLYVRRRLAALGLVLIFFVWWIRPSWQPVAVFLRIHLLEGVAWGAVASLLVRAVARRAWVQFGLLVSVVASWAAALYGLGVSPYDYVSLWVRYHHVEKQDFATLPETAHERIQPLASVRTLSNEVLSDTEHAAEPDVVRVDGKYRFTFAIEPSVNSGLRRFMQPITSVVSLPVTSPSFDFSSKTRDPVAFPLGEGLTFSRNVRTAVTRSLGPWRFFSYEPGDVKYIKDDGGEWVQMVTLTRWRGILFPWPEFGGVVVFRQRPDTLWSKISVSLFGAGEWIRPEDVPGKPFLAGQNLVPYEVSRYEAESFRFRAGFWAPAPGWHLGDIRVPHILEDRNPQPYTVYATWDGEESSGKLWHYFGLEPYYADKQGLSLSLFAPADGNGPMRVVSHGDQGFCGVSSVAPKVQESKKIFDWEKNAPVEHRPFIRTANGERRLFWLTTIVTFKKGGSGEFIAGAKPEITLTDAATQHVVWVDSNDPASWLPQLERELRAAAGSAEPPALGAK